MSFVLVPTTTDLPIDEVTATEPTEAEVQPDAATIEQFSLNVGAANVDYGPFASHRKYIPVWITSIQSESSN